MGTAGRTPESQPRKTFVNRVFGAAAAGFLGSVFYPVIRYLVPPPVAEAAASSVTLDVDPRGVAPNSGQIFKFGSKPGILIRTPSGDLRAFSAICTHLPCTVQYRSDIRHIWCACHNGHYDLNGINIAGPPPRPLEPYDVNVRGDRLVVGRRV